MYFMCYIILTSLSALTILMLTPMNLGLTILFMALSTATMFAMSHSSWMAFLVFLIYVSGMLVMFAYFIAISPNTPMNMTKPMMFLLPSMMITMSLMYYLPTPLTQFTYNINTFYNLNSGPTLIMLALILLLTMIIVVKITSLNKGPLRPFNYV